MLRAKNLCFGAKRMSVGRDASSDGAIRECVHEIEGKAGLSPKVTTAISSIILGDWDKAVEGVCSLRGEAKSN